MRHGGREDICWFRALLMVVFLSPVSQLLVLNCSAQEDPEYRAEVGAGLGLMTYYGDFNGNLTRNMQPAFGLIGRYKFNPRMGLVLNVSYGKIKGSSDDVDTWYPDMSEERYEFDNSLWDVGLRYEYNFWPYGTGREYRGAKVLSPYIAIGLGMTVAKNDSGTEVTANIPFAFGVKYKVATRLNLALEWAMSFSMSDWLDGVEDPYGIESSGIFKNADSYSVLRFSVTYDIMAKCKTCNNDRD